MLDRKFVTNCLSGRSPLLGDHQRPYDPRRPFQTDRISDVPADAAATAHLQSDAPPIVIPVRCPRSGAIRGL